MIKAINLIKEYWLKLSALILLAITVLSLYPLDNLPEVPGTDKTHHLIAYAALAYPAVLKKPNNWIYIIIFFIFYGGLIELIQPYVNRYGEWLDMLANTCGVFLGIILALITDCLYKREIKKQKH